ncbi:ABC transporter related [Parafrankia sp. EAN1pec]|uniref:ABC transporter ATP-binding protein n=1 Tax=Parafrankia sp. (strain EAN1pec) TaxID=298653 RepID=UPI00005443FE|nr:ABC transporter related [Frankia sp. EAN1pec]
MTALLELDSIAVRYGGVAALKGVSFTVPSNSIVGLIGPNGAGKTTLIDALTGFTGHDGTVTFDGRNLGGLAPHERVRLGMTRTFQSLELFEDLTVEQNLQVAAHRPTLGSALWGLLRGRAGVDDVRWALDRVNLTGSHDRLPTELSLGQRKLVGVARALVGRPRLLLLDEPAAGLDSAESEVLADVLRALPGDGLSILIIEHDTNLVFGLCRDVNVLEFGELIASGPAAEVRRDPAVLAAYLGADHEEDA